MGSGAAAFQPAVGKCRNRFAACLPLALLTVLPAWIGATAWAATQVEIGAPNAASSAAAASARSAQTRPDRSGKARKGKASYYGRQFYGKKMANGKRMDPRTNVAASKTLPIGTKAKVTNLETGKSAVVNIEDRGPYVKGRIVDLSPKTAQQLDIKKEGVAPVEVKPLAIPPKQGSDASSPGQPSSSPGETR